MVSNDEIKLKLKAKKEGRDPDSIYDVICPKCGKGSPRGSEVCLNCGEKLHYSGMLSSSGSQDIRKLVFYEPNDSGAKYSFTGISKDELAIRLNSLFIEEGYKLEKGSIDKGEYGRGSHALRMAVGVFAKRFKFQFNINSNDNITHLDIYKAMSGASGGVLAISAMNKETERITNLIKNSLDETVPLCPSCNTPNPDHAKFCQECGSKMK